MKTLQQASIEELQKEIESRKKAKDKKPEPLPSGEILWTKVRDMAIEYVDRIATEGYVGEDFDHYLFEEVLMSVYGRNIFKYVNAHMR